MRKLYFALYIHKVIYLYYMFPLMKCPKCNNMETKVIDSRVIEEWWSIRRRRECEYCKYRYTTYERIWQVDLIVIKKDGSKELYDRQKIKQAIKLAFAKRLEKFDRIDELITELEWNRVAQSSEVTSQTIWEDVLKVLRALDSVAYIRFASVYQKFENIDDFKHFLSIK